MEVLRIEIKQALFEKLFEAGHIKSEDYKLIDVKEPDFDYGIDQAWIEAKSNSTKAYKKLKEVEFNLRKKS